MDFKQLTSEVVKAADSLRKKYKYLSRERSERDYLLGEQFKPVSEPLKSIEDILITEKEKVEKPVEEDVKIPLVSSAVKTPIKPATKDYLSALLKETPRHSLDTIYGLTSSGEGKLSIGDTFVTIDNNILSVGDNAFKLTPGLYQLLLLKDPAVYSKNDLAAYREILILTSAHKQHYNASKQINSNRGTKYVKIISSLFKTKTGEGFLQTDRPVYEYYNDPNQLVERLRLLISSRDSGNNSHNNEIESIVDELKEGGYIV